MFSGSGLVKNRYSRAPLQNAGWEEGLTAVIALSYWELWYDMGILCWVICGKTPIYLFYFSNSNAIDLIQESVFWFLFGFVF